jgi:hypothetical protein
MALPSRSQKRAHVYAYWVVLPWPGEAVEFQEARGVHELTGHGSVDLQGDRVCAPHTHAEASAPDEYRRIRQPAGAVALLLAAT